MATDEKYNDAAQATCGMSKGLRRHEETWWWNKEVAEAVTEKKKYGNWKKEKLTEAWKEYKKSKQNAKKRYFLSKENKTE